MSMDLGSPPASAGKTPKSVRFAPSPAASSSPHESTLFAIEDDDSDPYGAPHVGNGGSSSSDSNGKSKSERLAYGLKSTIPSREAEYDAASDTYSDDGNRDDPTEGLGRSHSSARALLTSGSSSSSPRRPLPTIIPSGIRQSVDGIGGNIAEFRRNVLEGLEGVGQATGLTNDSGELPDWLKRGAGVFDATTNMANSILGAGIVGLPYSMRQSGFVAGVVLLSGLALLTDWTIRLIILNSKLSGKLTYIDIMDHCFGQKGKAAVSLFQFAFAFGGMCAFCVVIGDTIPHVLSSIFPSLAPGASFFSFMASRTFVITFCTLLISYPLSLYRSIENLSKASAVALISMVLIVGTVIVRGPAMPAELKGDPSLRLTIVNPSNLVSSISVISFAFVCHHNSLLIYASLKEPSMDKFGKVTHYSTAIACAALTAMSIAGYWTFEEKTLGNVLNNFPENDTFVNIARFAFGVNMFTTFPLEAFVCREVLETYFFANEYSPKLHIVLTTSLVFSSLFVSLLTCDLGIVLELTGGLSATALAFIFPAICFLKLSKEGEGKKIHLSRGGGGSRSGGRYQAVSGEDDQATTSGERNSLRNSSDLARLEADEGPRQATNGRYSTEEEDEEEEEGAISISEIDLPIRPGAPIRARRSSDPHQPPSNTLLPEGNTWESWKYWLKSGTKPLAVGCALFGTVVLVISVGQSVSILFGGGGSEGHRKTC